MHTRLLTWSTLTVRKFSLKEKASIRCKVATHHPLELNGLWNFEDVFLSRRNPKNSCFHKNYKYLFFKTNKVIGIWNFQRCDQASFLAPTNSFVVIAINFLNPIWPILCLEKCQVFLLQALFHAPANSSIVISLGFLKPLWQVCPYETWKFGIFRESTLATQASNNKIQSLGKKL